METQSSFISVSQRRSLPPPIFPHINEKMILGCCNKTLYFYEEMNFRGSFLFLISGLLTDSCYRFAGGGKSGHYWITGIMQRASMA
jgi:hypothetical protein